ncbi:CTD phosphatase Fcp1 [Coemansia sp. RSA 552]|nr:CTD phosphatase Fcp1 [Coemansia sp. RSA 552]
MDNIKSLGIPRRHHPAKIVEVKVQAGDRVEKLAPLLTYEYREKPDPDDPAAQQLLKALHKRVAEDGTYGKREYLRTPFEGKVAKVTCGVGDSVVFEQVLVEITVPCSHGTVFNGLCGLCGKDVSEIDTSGIPDTQAHIDMFHDANGLKVSTEVAAQIDADTRDSLWDRKKLSLIIDLDQTIVHAATTLNPEFEQWLIDNYQGPEDEEAAEGTLPGDIGKFYLPGSPVQYFVKMRAGLKQFLGRISELYEMHIYTMGTRPYADAVAALVDPEGRYFNRRILSRDESGSSEVKSIRRLFPVDTSMVAILDDRDDVWEWSPNLIKVHPFMFFPGIGDINAGGLARQKATAISPPPLPPLKKSGQPGGEEEAIEDCTGNHALPPEEIIEVTEPEKDAATESKKSEAGEKKAKQYLEDSDRQLYTLQKVLADVHQRYYAELDPAANRLPDLARILTESKQRVLAGCTIVFTAVFSIAPGSPPPQQTEPWRRAQMFGATCELEISDRTTHVVAGKPGTEKVMQARRKKLVVVKTNWFLDSTVRWKRLDEVDYLWHTEDLPMVARLHNRLENTHKEEESAGGGPRHASLRRLTEAEKMDSANTTDIEDELERQEAGLEEHEAEVDSFVQNIDWDDLEREAMEDSESDADDHAHPAAPNLRQTALRNATYAGSVTSSGSGSDDDLSDNERHRMKRRRKTTSHLANGGAVDLNSEEDSSAEPQPATARARLAKRLGITDDELDESGRSSGDSSGDEYYTSDRNKVNETLFAGIEDPQGAYFGDEGDLRPVRGDGDDEDGAEHQWGEDDESDDENFDDLINNLEEEISSS